MKKIIRAALASATVLSIALSANTFAAKSKKDINVASSVKALKVGVVDYMTVFQMVPQGKEKLMELKKGVQPKVDSLQKKQNDLQAKMMQLQKDAPTLTDKQKQTREQSLMQQQANFQKEVASLQQEEQAKEQEAATAFQRDVKSAIEKIGKKRL